MKRNHIFIIVFLFIISLSGILILTAHSSVNPSGRLNRALAEFATDTSLGAASWGFMASHVPTGNIIASINPDLALIPASTQKLLTTTAALAMLGHDFRFSTLLQHDGSIEGGLLKGNLYISGQGDPTLGAVQLHDSLHIENTFNRWLTKIRAAGIEKIEGHIIADGSAFDNHMVPPKWLWEDLGNYYGAGAHALSIHENMYTVFFQPGRREGDAARVLRVEPPVEGMEFINDVTTGPRGSGDRVYIYAAPGSNKRWLTGTVPLGQTDFPVRGSLPDPGMHLASQLRNYLEKNGMSVSPEVFTHNNAPRITPGSGRVLLDRRLSPSLDVIARRINMHSVNSYAENLFKYLGLHFGQEGSYSKGAEVLRTFWQQQGMTVRGLRIHDGSGLSPFNNITPAQLLYVLGFAAGNTKVFDALTPGLPLAGRSGTLERLFLNRRSQGILMAKSGFLGNVRAYAGYTRNSNNELIAFTFVVNNYAGPSAVLRDRMVRVMDAIGE